QHDESHLSENRPGFPGPPDAPADGGAAGFSSSRINRVIHFPARPPPNGSGAPSSPAGVSRRSPAFGRRDILREKTMQRLSVGLLVIGAGMVLSACGGGGGGGGNSGSGGAALGANAVPLPTMPG